MFELPNLDEIDPDIVQNALEQTRTRLQEKYPELDLKRGVLHDTVLTFHSVLTAAVRTNFDRYQRSRSLQQIEADPSLADGDVVDHVLSNWGVARQPGELSSGRIIVVLSDDTSVTLPRDSVWLAAGHEYRTTSVFTAKPEADLIFDDTDRLLRQRSDGRWEFEIDVVSRETGQAARLSKDTAILPEAQPDNFVTAYAKEDFAGGRDVETNAELLRRLREGVATRSMSSRITMSGMLRRHEPLSRVVRDSIIGFGDPEMHRDQHTVFPGSFGGRADWYVRTQHLLDRRSVRKTATVTSLDADNNPVWLVSLPAADCLGCYEVRSVRPAGLDDVLGSLPITATQRGLDLTGEDFIPDMVTAVEGSFSPFQTLAVEFVEPDGAAQLGDTGDFDLELAGLPLLREAQQYVSSRNVRHFAGDVLVKAPVPCFVKVDFVVETRTPTSADTLREVREAVAAEVNDTPFHGELNASRLYDIVYGFVDGDSSIREMDLLGRIVRPDGSLSHIRDRSVLVVPDEPGRMVTANTVQFFCDPLEVVVTPRTSARRAK